MTAGASVLGLPLPLPSLANANLACGLVSVWELCWSARDACRDACFVFATWVSHNSPFSILKKEWVGKELFCGTRSALIGSMLGSLSAQFECHRSGGNSQHTSETGCDCCKIIDPSTRLANQITSSGNLAELYNGCLTKVQLFPLWAAHFSASYNLFILQK